MAKAGLMFAKRDEWYTPKEVVDFFGPFDYDPATTKKQAKYLGIPDYDTIRTDGLRPDWRKYERIWLNPPFSRKFEFLSKTVWTAMYSHSTKIFYLCPAETITTKKFHEIVGGQPYRMWIPNGRIKFNDGSGKASSPAFGSIVLEFGRHIVRTEIKHWRLDGQDS